LAEEACFVSEHRFTGCGKSAGSYQGIAPQLAEKWMFFCKTLLVSAFSRLLPVRFLCTRLDFDPAANARSCA